MYTGVFEVSIPAAIPERVRAVMNMAMWTLPAINADATVRRTAATAVAIRRPHLEDIGDCKREPINAPPKNLKKKSVFVVPSTTPFKRQNAHNNQTC
jgi:hypothetical protein